MKGENIRDEQRYPTLTNAGRDMLKFLREHPHAPIYRNESGNRLSAEDVEQAHQFERTALVTGPHWPTGGIPGWVVGFVERCFRDVPFYRAYGTPPARFSDIPTISRADLSRDVAPFVPDPVDAGRLIIFSTSGTTGHPLLLASDPLVAANYLAFHKRALLRFGIELTHGQGAVGVVLVGWQRRCFTYVSVTPTMDESGLAKINLHPDDWRDPEDRGKYIDSLAPEIITGDPISLAELAKLRVRVRPRALLSTSMTLLPALRQFLENRFGCPVLDVYSMNEAGPLAVWDERLRGHVLLQHCTFVEILDPQGRAVPPGVRGEVALTGGFNFCLPLLRYRTGDYAALESEDGEWVLRDLHGRPPVCFFSQDGRCWNNVDITHTLAPFGLRQFTLHQAADGTLTLHYSGGNNGPALLRKALLNLFGEAQPLEIREVDSFNDKVIQYTSDYDAFPS